MAWIKPIAAALAFGSLVACTPTPNAGSGSIPKASGPAAKLELGASRAEVEAILGEAGPQVRDPANTQRLCVSYPYVDADGATLYSHAVYLGDVLAAIGDGNTAPCAP